MDSRGHFIAVIYSSLSSNRANKFPTFILGSSIERLCDVAASDPTGYAQLDDRGPMVRAARALLGSVTRVLLLADIVVVKQLLLAKDRVRKALSMGAAKQN